MKNVLRVTKVFLIALCLCSLAGLGKIRLLPAMDV